VAGHQRVEDLPCRDLGQVHVLGVRLDRPECGNGRLDLLADGDCRVEVPVLERAPAARVDADPVWLDVRDLARDDGERGRAVRRRDVDSEVERKRAGTGHERLWRRRIVEHHARVAQVRSHGVRGVERLDGPTVARASRRHSRQRTTASPIRQLRLTLADRPRASRN
jgi:hypothetical protein